MTGTTPAETTLSCNASDNSRFSDTSIIVIGAGLVGAVQALLFARAGFNVTVVERNVLRDEVVRSDAISSRTVALSYRSWQLLTESGLWPGIDCCPIKNVHVTEQGNFGSVKLNANKLDVEALGFVLSNAGFENYLHGQLKSQANVQIIESASVVAVENNQHSAQITIEQSGERTELDASLIVAADGTQSTVRQLLGIETKLHDYEQCAVLANVSTSKTSVGTSKGIANTAYERFTRDGPLALLPLGCDPNVAEADQPRQGNLYSMIYTVPSAQAARMSEISDDELLRMVQKKFGGRLGCFESIGKRYVAKLALTVSMQQTSGRFVLIGNAMRTLHPVAGQGMNLALRDVYELVAGISNSENIDDGLVEFVKRRQRDQWWVTKQTDLLARMFAEKPLPLRLPASMLTSSGFVLLDIIAPFKKAFAVANMGGHVSLPYRAN